MRPLNLVQDRVYATLTLRDTVHVPDVLEMLAEMVAQAVANGRFDADQAADKVREDTDFCEEAVDTLVETARRQHLALHEALPHGTLERWRNS